MQHYAVIAGLIQFDFHQVQIPNVAIGKNPHTITEPPPCFTVGVIQGVATFLPTLRLT